MSRFTARTLAPCGRQRVIRGRRVHVTYANRHATVEYVERRGRLTVTVTLAGRDPVSWDTVAAWPSVETARLAAEAAYNCRHGGAP